MTPQDWADVAAWMLLAVGAAVVLGTGAALVRYRRTGTFPGQPLDEDGTPLAPPALRTAWTKVAIGVVLAVWGLASLTRGVAS